MPTESGSRGRRVRLGAASTPTEVDFGGCRAAPGDAEQAPHLTATPRTVGAGPRRRLLAKRLIKRARPADEGDRRRLPDQRRGLRRADRRSTSPRRTGSTSAALVRDLARALRGRIELRQVGARDGRRAERRTGQLRPGPVLRDLPDRLRAGQPADGQADQDLPLNPLRISGACGRLMCCLKYEHPLYAEFAQSSARRRQSRSARRTVMAPSSPTTCRPMRSSSGSAVPACRPAPKADVCPSRAAYNDRSVDSVLTRRTVRRSHL